MGLARRWRESTLVIEIGRARLLAMVTMAAGVCALCQADFPPTRPRAALEGCPDVSALHCPPLPLPPAVDAPESQQRHRASRHRLANPSTPTESARPHRTLPWLRGRGHHMPTRHGHLQECGMLPMARTFIQGRLLAYAITDMNEANSHQRETPHCDSITPQSPLNAIQPILSHFRPPPTASDRLRSPPTMNTTPPRARGCVTGAFACHFNKSTI